MAGLYGSSSSAGGASEGEEMTSFLQHLLLHNSNSASDFLSSDPPSLSKRTFDHNNNNNASSSKSTGLSIQNDYLNHFGFDSQKGGSKETEIPSDMVRPRNSSKRSRAAEVHNLSEKRRRSRINEKMKALQNLIPNSNKTDKASMLDEAIEYLKQLQLQVQMLTMRNGLSLHPMCLPGVLQPVQLPLAGMNFDEENGLLNVNTMAGAFSANEDSATQSGLTLPAHRAILPNQSIAIPSGATIPSSETSFGFEPLIQVQHGPFSLTPSSKEICREGLPQAQLDTKASSSGVS